jgi:hypothetical protein
MADDLTQDVIEEGDIVEETTTVSTESNDTSAATVLLSLEEMIKNNIASIDKLTAELREKKHMFSDVFQNDTTYKEQEEKVKEANVVKMQTRQQILKQPAIIQLAEKIKSMSADMKERRAALSDYLLEYQRLTQATTIEDLEGNVREIINDAKVVLRSSKK